MTSRGPGLGDRDAGYKVFDLSADGTRGGMDAAAAAEAAKVITDGDTSFTKIRLSSKALSPEAAATLADAFRSLPGLVVADLSDIIAGRPEAEGLAVYEALGEVLKDKPLVEIDLSDNALGPKGVKACTAMLTGQEHLERAYFLRNGLSAEAMASIADLFTYRTPTKLNVLHFFNNMSGDDGARAAGRILAASPDMANFRMASTRVGAEGGLALAAGLQSTSKLIALDLTDNTFGAAMGPALAPVLRANSGLLELNLGDTGLEDDGVAAVCRAIATGCRQLEVLNLSANDITPDGAALAVARTIKRLPALRELYLDDNIDLESEGTKVIARGITSREVGAADPLATVSMPGCGMGRWGAAALAAACAALPALARLNLNESMISAKGVAELQKLFEGKDDVLTLDDNDEDNEDEDDADDGDAGALSDDSWGDDDAEGGAGGASGAAVDDLADAVAGVSL